MDIPLELFIMILKRRELKGCAGLLRCVCLDWSHLVESTNVSVSMVVRNRRVFEWAAGAGRRKHMQDDILVGEYGDEDVLHEYVCGKYVSLNVWNGAAKGGRIDVFEHIVRRGYDISCSDTTCAFAAKYGHLEALKWLRAHGTPWSRSVVSSAIKGSHFEVLKWAYYNGCAYTRLSAQVATSGNLDMIEWMDGTGCEKDKDACTFAAMSGNVHALQWLRKRGYPWDKFTCSHTALSGRLNVLEWARDNGCPWDEDTCNLAAMNGHLDVLKWARKNGCPWDKDVCIYAVRGLHLEVLQWAVTNGAPINVAKCIEELEEDIPSMGYAFDGVVYDNPRDLLDWLRSIGP